MKENNKIRARTALSSSLNECNGHANNFKRITRDKFQCTNTNGSRSPNCETKIDKTKEERKHIQPQIKYNRSQRCLEHNDILVQSSFNNTPIYSKFAFHQIIRFTVILLLFVARSVTCQQQQESRQESSQNAGESLYESCFPRRYELNHVNRFHEISFHFNLFNKNNEYVYFLNPSLQLSEVLC